MSSCHVILPEPCFALSPSLLSLVCAAQTILNSHALIEKSSEYASVRRWLGDGLATAGPERWRKHRKILLPAFHTPVINNFIPCFNDHAILLCQAISDKLLFPDFHEYIVNVTLDIICGECLLSTLTSESCFPMSCLPQKRCWE